MKEILVTALLTVVWSLQSTGSDVVQIKPTAAVAAETKINDNVHIASSSSSSSSTDGGGINNGTSPCERYLRSAEVEVRSPRNHKFVTSNGWSERQRPRPEINVYSRVEELSSPPPPSPPTASAAFYQQQQQRDSFYQHSRQQQLQQPAVRTSKRIIYYATLPDVIRPPASYPPLLPPPGYAADPFALGPGPFSTDFRPTDTNRIIQPDVLQRNRLASYENAYNRGGGGVTSVTTKSQSVYNSRYDEPAEFRDSFYRPNEFTSKFASWAEPFYKSWSSSSWDKEPPSYSGNRGSPSFSWDREPQLNRGGGGSWDNRGSSWDNRGSAWDKELVEVPLQKPSGGARDNFNSDKYPEVAVVHSGVIDVRGDRQQSNSPHPTPPPRFTIIDVDPKPYHQQQNNIVQPQQNNIVQQQQMPPSMRYDERSKPTRYESPMQPTRYESPMQPSRYEPPMPYDAPQKPMRYEAYTPMQPPTRYEQQYRPQQQQQPPPQSSWTSTSSSSSSSTRDGQNQNKKPTNGYYENIKNNINTHQFMTSWTEVSNQDDVSPTHTVSIDITSLGNTTTVQNNTRITPYTNTTKTPK